MQDGQRELWIVLKVKMVELKRTWGSIIYCDLTLTTLCISYLCSLNGIVGEKNGLSLYYVSGDFPQAFSKSNDS